MASNPCDVASFGSARLHLGAALLVCSLAPAIAVPAIAGQPVPIGEALKWLQHPDAPVRLSGVRRLRDADNPDALAALAPLLHDPADEVQIETIDAILSLLLIDPISTRRRVALVVEVRRPGRAEAAFEAGPAALAPLALPPELVAGLGAAMLDNHPRVRTDATYAFGAVARPPLGEAIVQALLDGLLHPEPVVRLAATRVIGRLGVRAAGESLIYAINDPFDAVRIAAMRSLGDLREERAIQALTDQFNYYRIGRHAEAALDGLARMGHATLLPLFDTVSRASGSEGLRRIAFEGIGRAARPAAAAGIEASLNPGSSRGVALARAFALTKLGRPYLGEIVAGLGQRDRAVQSRDYLIEIGPPGVAALQGYLHDANPRVRAGVAEILSLIGPATLIAQLDPLRADPDPEVALAAARAVQRLQRGGLKAGS